MLRMIYYLWCMKKCLFCETEFDSSKESAKFCSDVCRVRYNRNSRKTDTSIQDQEKSLLSQTMDVLLDLKQAISELKLVVGSFVDSVQQKQQPETFVVGNRQKFEQYAKQKREIESEEAWDKLKKEIEKCPDLNGWQKRQLIN